MRQRLLIVVCTLVFFVSGSFKAQAGPYSDQLAKCLISSTTVDDRNALVRWIFAATSHHPAVKSIVTVSAAQRDQFDKEVADLFMKLLTQSCLKETKEAIKFEGKEAIPPSFNLLGQTAGREMVSDPAVAGSMGSFLSHFDKAKLQEALGESLKGK